MIWSLDLSVRNKKLKGHNDYINSIAFSPTSNEIASGSNDKTIKIWNLETGICEKTFEEHTE